MWNINKNFGKLLGVYNALDSRIHNYHNGGSASEWICTDLEYTLGLDNRGEMGVIWLIVLPVSVITIGVILLVGSELIKIITNPAVIVLAVIFLLLVCYTFMSNIWGH